MGEAVLGWDRVRIYWEGARAHERRYTRHDRRIPVFPST